jgi:hypothetical protein
MALTHNFQSNGDAVDWGIEPILHRIKSIDLWNRDLVNEQEKQYDEKKKAIERESKNKAEDEARELRSAFKKTFNDYNVSTLNKIDKRRNDEVKNVNY